MNNIVYVNKQPKAICYSNDLITYCMRMQEHKTKDIKDTKHFVVRIQINNQQNFVELEILKMTASNIEFNIVNIDTIRNIINDIDKSAYNAFMQNLKNKIN